MASGLNTGTAAKTQDGTPAGQAPAGADPQAGTDKGQASLSADELTAVLGRTRQEAADLRIKLRDYETRTAADEAKRKADEAEAAKKRGEFETLYQKAEAEKALLAQQLETERFDAHLRFAIRDLQPAADISVDDVMKLVDRTGLKLKDGKVEGLDTRLADFKKAKPTLFQQAQAPAKGLPGFPGNGAAAGHPNNAPITDAVRREAEERKMDPQYWANHLAARAARQKAGTAARS